MHIPHHSTRTIQKVIKAANILSIPVHATEQMPSRLGPTIPELAALLPTPAIPKTTFSMLGAAELAQRLAADADADGRPWTVAVVGIEAHVCVAQTARDLRAAGHCAHVLADGVGSCNDGEVRVALSRLRAEHVAVSSSEAFLYEVMRDAAIPEFRQVLAVVREAGPDTAAAARRMMALL